MLWHDWRYYTWTLQSNLKILALLFVTRQTKHGTPVDVFESAAERRGADGIDARA
jgi:hypothetical protein